ncbi:Or9e8 [Eciton burchellii]|nr:Or9e8 [Eciton burchellii]
MLKNFLQKYNINKIFLSLLGLWPFQKKLLRNSLRIFCFLLEISYCPFELLLLYDHWDDAQLIYEGCYQITLSASFLIRIINEFWNHDKLRKLYQSIDEHWDIFTNEIDVRVLKHYSLLSRKFTLYYFNICNIVALMYVLMSGFLIIPLTPVFLDIVSPLNESRPRFLAIEVEFRMDKNEHFLSLFIYITAIIVIGMSIMVAVDAMHVTCTAHACSLFAAVSQQVENIILKVDNETSKHCMNTKTESFNEEITYREYITCLKKFVDILASSYQGFSLVLLMLIISTLSLIGIRIVYVLDQVEEMIRFIFIIMGALMTLMIACYSSQRLMDESQNVFYRAYAAEWYNYSPRLKSLLIIILYRSNVSCGLKAGNIIPLSISTYMAVVRMGVSYFTAFLSLKD